MNIVLRSASPRRKELLGSAGYNFTVAPADIDETLLENLTPYENVKRLGLLKAQYEKEKYENSLIIGCDTIVVLDDKIYGKPKNADEAFVALKNLSGKTHKVMSGVGIIYKDKTYNFVVVSEVVFKNLTDEEILNYIATGECFGKAGSYAIQGLGGNLIAQYRGSLDNIIGLPLAEVEAVIGEINGMEN